MTQGRDFTQKLVDYALNLDHVTGGAKAKFFKEVLNIEKDDWQYLAEQIKLAVNEGEVHEIRVGEHGIQYHVDIVIAGLNGINANIRTAWIIRPYQSMQLVTVHPIPQPLIYNMSDFNRPEMAISKKLIGEDRWKELYRIATTSGEMASENHMPTPVILHPTQEVHLGGKLGRALILFTEIKHDFVQWLNKNEKGFFSDEHFIITISHKTQSVEKACAYASEFSRVVKAQGIDIKVETYLD
ncbi:hypothetical protein M4S82_10545 [Planococcus sp. MERTA32b]|nr:hypothetical protein [Planococcus sp. MER TA 32b]